jgi:cell division control protein 24
MILLCCKEVNTTKQKNKITGRQLVDRKGRPKLQLKGRIFMQNVTDILSSAKPGSYTCQIFWKGDPGIEYFTIKYTSEDTLKKWTDQIQHQQVAWRSQLRSSAQRSVPDDEFQHMRDLQLENPFLQQRQDDDDDDIDGSTLASYPSHFSMGCNDSNPSLRSRSGTMESIGPPIHRHPPRQFPMGSQAPALQVRTGGMQMPPHDFQDSSFFSPATESPISTRSSGTPSMYSYHNRSLIGSQLGGPPMVWDEHRYTAPAMPRSQLHSYQPAARMPQRPSLPPSAHSSSVVQNRLRSASSPDIANPLQRRYDPSQVPPMPDLPPFPAAYAYPPNVLSRSQSSSPAQAMSGMPIRASPSPQVQPRMNQTASPRGIPMQHPPQMVQAIPMGGYGSHQPDVRVPSGPIGMQPPPQLGSPMPMEHHQALQQQAAAPLPTQLKVKVHCPSAGSSMTFVVPYNISYQSLKDRIDVKLQRTTSLSLNSGQVKLKYLDDDDYVSISSDEDVQMAFETWRESQRGQTVGGIGEIELFIQ